MVTTIMLFVTLIMLQKFKSYLKLKLRIGKTAFARKSAWEKGVIGSQKTAY